MSFFKQKQSIVVVNTALSAMKIIALSVCILLTACSTTNEDYNPAKKHHRPEGFQNNYIEDIDKSRLDLLRWKWQSIIAGLPKHLSKLRPWCSPISNL